MDSGSIPAAAVGWLHFAALIAVWGAVSSRWLIVPRAPERLRQPLVAAARRVGLVAGTVLVAAMELVYWRQLVDFRDPFLRWRDEAVLLLTTEWGRAWALAAVGAVLLLMLFLTASPTGRGSAARRASWILATVVAAALSAFPAFTGHAASSEGLRGLLIPLDIVHVLAAGSWIGGLLFVLVADLVERRRTGGGSSLLGDVVPLFSPVALVSAGVLVATGTLAAFVHIESPGALLSSTYGRLLLAKVALVLLVMVMGAINWRRLTPRLLGGEDGGALRGTAVRELVVAQLVILVTALLVRTPPM